MTCLKTGPSYQIGLGPDHICRSCKEMNRGSNPIPDIALGSATVAALTTTTVTTEEKPKRSRLANVLVAASSAVNTGATYVAKSNSVLAPLASQYLAKQSTDSAADQGRQLEEIIHAAAQKIPGISRVLRELEIRSFFGDSSLNGVDHMITLGQVHILIQDKWKETTTQQEVSQFITCAERIQSRLEKTDRIYLIWASKKEPTSNSAKMLNERNVTQVCCGVSLEALSRCVILQVCECLSVSPIASLMSIESVVKPVPMGPSRHAAVAVPVTTVATPAPVVILPFDETVEGKREIDAMKQLITSIRNGILQRAETAMRMDGIPDIYMLWTSAMPKSLEDWWSGTVTKVDFNGYLKTVKNICWPTSKKHLPFRNLCYYTKLRKISVEFATLAADYELRRKGLLGKKSVWAKALPVLKALAEPMTDAEFRGGVKDTLDYRQEKPEHVRHLEMAFHTHQCTPY
uniref:Uncharacterized protein n=1 Tax=viral metagenome TaxID=1070528 RepID=A0A6C0AQ29_9ZZZZ